MSETVTTSVGMPICLWIRLLRQLRRRGAGYRESGAFLLGRRLEGQARVTAFVCYDDLDPNACQSGAITFHARGYAALWEHCRNRGLQIIADVHTHPGSHVGQSSVDRHHPMLPVTGHMAIIVPCFARTSLWSLRSIGMYEYLGNFEWRSHLPSHHRPIKLTLW